MTLYDQLVLYGRHHGCVRCRLVVAQAIRRGRVSASTAQGSAGRDVLPHECTREVADTFVRLAKTLARGA